MKEKEIKRKKEWMNECKRKNEKERMRKKEKNEKEWMKERMNEW